MSTFQILLMISPLLLIIFIVILNTLSKDTKEEKKSLYRYYAHNSPMTKNEQKFFNILVDILRDDYYVFPQIHLSSIANHRVKGQNWKSALNHIDRKSVDFLVCDKSLNSVLCIEIDDETHMEENRMIRDEEVENILRSIKIPLLRIESKNWKNWEYIKRMITEKLSKK